MWNSPIQVAGTDLVTRKYLNWKRPEFILVRPTFFEVSPFLYISVTITTMVCMLCQPSFSEVVEDITSFKLIPNLILQIDPFWRYRNILFCVILSVYLFAQAFFGSREDFDELFQLFCLMHMLVRLMKKL